MRLSHLKYTMFISCDYAREFDIIWHFDTLDKTLHSNQSLHNLDIVGIAILFSDLLGEGVLQVQVGVGRWRGRWLCVVITYHPGTASV